MTKVQIELSDATARAAREAHARAILKRIAVLSRPFGAALEIAGETALIAAG
ncbi:MAG TPA: hypothetical protein VF924_05805 [Stellaceae bacterium]